MTKKTIDPEIIKVCKSVSAYTASKWHGVITFDEALSEAYNWLASNLDKVEAWKKADPNRWRNSLAFSLKNEIGRLGQKEVDYYSKNNGAIEQKLEELQIETEHLKDENSFLQTKSYYNDKTQLQDLLYFVETNPNNIDKKVWKEHIPFIDYRDAQPVVAELASIFYGLTKNQQTFIKEKYVAKLTDIEIGDLHKMGKESLKSKNNRIIKLIQLKLQQTNMVW